LMRLWRRSTSTMPSAISVTLSLWDTSTGKPLRRFIVPAGEADNLCLAADGRTLATGGQGAALHLWDSVAGKPVLTWPAHSRRINALSFTPDGRRLVSCDGQTLRLREVSSARHLKELSRERPRYLCNFAITSDGRSVLSGGHTLLRLQELPAGEERQRFLLDEHPEKLPKPVGQLTGHLAEHIGLSTDGRVAACVSTASSVHEAHVWDLATGRLLVHREIGSQIQLLGITPDATATIEQRDTRTVPSGVSLSVKDLANLTQLVLRDLRTGRHLLTLSLPDLFRSSVCAVSPDGRTLVTATTSATQGEKKILWGPSTIRFWELASGKERMAIACGGGWEESRFKKFAFAPDGRTMATVGDDRSLRLWDAVTGNELLRRTGFPSQATALTFAPGGTSLATGHADSTILIWDIAAPKRASERPDRELKAKDLERCWSALAGDDAPAAWRAVWEMAAAARQVVPLLRQRLRPVAAATDEELRPLLADLDSTEFARRKAASARLAKLGERAVPALENVLKAAPSPEKRRRIEGLLPTSQIVRSPEVLSHVRAIEVLEHVGTIEAQQVLKTLVQGMPQSRITREAKASLERLTARRPAEKR
jgi:WD40 repeat protein